MTPNVLVVGGSAGGIEPLMEVVAGLPADLGACVLVSIHISPSARSRLPHLLSRRGALAAESARDGMPLQPGTILVAPPDQHLLLRNGLVHLSSGPKVNRHRPSIDVMFASAARWFGTKVVALTLSGALDDGAVGAALIHRAGGKVFVQDPGDALFPSIPRATLSAVPTATALPAAALPAALSDAIRSVGALRWTARDDRQGATEMSMADSDNPQYLSDDESSLTRLMCPDCHGGLAQVDLPHISFYRCHVGHQWSPQNLVAAQAESAEDSLWSAVSSLEEQAALCRHLATLDLNSAADAETAAEHLRAAERAAELAATLTNHLRRGAARP